MHYDVPTYVEYWSQILPSFKKVHPTENMSMIQTQIHNVINGISFSTPVHLLAVLQAKYNRLKSNFTTFFT
jgi:hypothetical protein